MSRNFQSYINTINIQTTILTFALKSHENNEAAYDFMNYGQYYELRS